MKRVVIVHGWGGSPEDNWIPWLRKEMEKGGFEVIVPREYPVNDGCVSLGQAVITAAKLKKGINP